ncbi:MAG: hypothetical protein WAK93_22090 [Solirubrobacteraceae bacterium]
MTRRLASAAGVVILCAALAGCGATPPQAPLAQAKKLDASLGGLSSACGLAYQVAAFAKPGTADLRSYETSASTQARKLASVYAANPTWIYQGETVRKIVHDSIAMLDSCGLTQAGATLRSQTRR